jgi:hypothetical protein
MLADLNPVDPRQNVIPSRRLPASDVRNRRAGRERAAHVGAAMPALPALKAVFSHVAFHRFSLGMLRVKNQATNPGIPISFSFPMQKRCMSAAVLISGEVNAPLR